jgi:hypothetical protein
LATMSDDDLTHEQIRMAMSLARMAHLKRLLEPGHPLFSTEEIVLNGWIRGVHGAGFQYVLDNYKRIAAEHHEEIVFDPKA